MAYNKRKGVNQGQTRRSFKHRAGKTMALNQSRPLRGGIRL